MFDCRSNSRLWSNDLQTCLKCPRMRRISKETSKSVPAGLVASDSPFCQALPQIPPTQSLVNTLSQGELLYTPLKWFPGSKWTKPKSPVLDFKALCTSDLPVAGLFTPVPNTYSTSCFHHFTVQLYTSMLFPTFPNLAHVYSLPG